MFDLSTLEQRFAHVATEINAESEKHAALEAEFVTFAGKIVPDLPYGQDVEDVVSLLVSASHLAHRAIDVGAQRSDELAGVVRVNDKVVSGGASGPASAGAAVTSPGDGTVQEAPVAATPPAAPEAPAPA